MNDTIAAISTSLGKGAISIIRVSGPKAINIVNKIFIGNNLNKCSSHTINYGYIKDKEEKIDEVLVSLMKAPKTFTMEDVVEINCHGGTQTTKKIFEILLLNGIRIAEPGEFTKRAFLNGRIDLVEAESVMEIINAETENARKLSINNLTVNLSNEIKIIREDLLNLLANIEVNIDYPEYEDIEVINIQKIKVEIQKIKIKIEKLVNTSENSKIIKEGIKTLIIGKPNVGKSSLLNSLLEEEKAIVTDIAGTTRDIVEGKITIEGIILDLIDTAGIRSTEDVIEKIGVNKSLGYIDDADLILAVFDVSNELSTEDYKIIDKIKNKNVIAILNKIDLKKDYFKIKVPFKRIVYTNTKDYKTIENLKREIINMYNLNKINASNLTYLSNVRQITLGKEALELTLSVLEGINNNIPIDIIAIDIKLIWEKLGEIIGKNYADDLLDKLFSNFCLGK
ncbi:MAG: tRNA uridine-5-carboxymethylaminomethyl(34) synthesis GTPase MnmE [Tenericutes bacterium]|nr:tRNA uridine-5-carboxymethylaminomethyl(34) synthesis GTPase MnmE [Mycoplasmatota bacterium]